MHETTSAWVSHPEFLPDSELSRDAMESLQREIAEMAVFSDAGARPDGREQSNSPGPPPNPAAIRIERPFDISAGVPTPTGRAAEPADQSAPVVVGVDQAFLDNQAVSAAVALRGEEVIECASALTPLETPYIPGLLSFREGVPVLAALETLSEDPDLLVLDGSGRIHYRQAGLATHIGVITETPAIGVAKSLLCGTPDASVDGRSAGWSTPIRADNRIEAAQETIVGHAYQSRQYETTPRINPLYVSPGHGLSAVTARDLVAALCGGYKLPAPTRLADAYAEEVKQDHV